MRSKLEIAENRRSGSTGSTRTSGGTRVAAAGRSDVSASTAASWDTESVRDLFERVSAAQAAFEDSNRGRNLTMPETGPLPYTRHLADASSPATSSHTACTNFFILVFLIVTTIAVVVYYLLRASERDLVIVEASWSTYRGLRKKFEGRTVFTFLGIPFAVNTSGWHRFRQAHPVPSSKLTIVDATKQKPPCTQAPLPTPHKADKTSAPTSEDCLHLNLWTPSLPSPTHRPKTVVVFLYGVAFKWSSNGDFDATPLSSLGDIVVVTPNYRLHALGFLGDGSDEYPGNLALYDHNLALQWVQNNVEFFGGNASSVVLHGYEAGAASIGYHMLSPINHWAEAYSRLILQSGSPFRSYKENPELSVLMSVFGCSRTGWPCLQALQEGDFSSPNVYYHFDFRPSFQSKYLPQGPERLARKSPIQNKQVLLGNVLDEGSFTAEIHKSLTNLGSKVVAEPVVTVYLERELIQAGVRSFESVRGLYVNDSAWKNDEGAEVAREIFGDAFFKCPVQYFADHLAAHGSTAYKYLWTYKPTFGPWAHEEFGPTQYDDLAFVFGSPLLGTFPCTAEEETLSRRTIELFSGFAKTGALPDVNGETWPAYNQSAPITVEIGLQGFTTNSTSRNERCSRLRQYLNTQW